MSQRMTNLSGGALPASSQSFQDSLYQGWLTHPLFLVGCHPVLHTCSLRLCSRLRSRSRYASRSLLITRRLSANGCAKPLRDSESRRSVSACATAYDAHSCWQECAATQTTLFARPAVDESTSAFARPESFSASSFLGSVRLASSCCWPSLTDRLRQRQRYVCVQDASKCGRPVNDAKLILNKSPLARKGYQAGDPQVSALLFAYSALLTCSCQDRLLPVCI